MDRDSASLENTKQVMSSAEQMSPLGFGPITEVFK